MNVEQSLSAKQLVEARKISLCASFSDDSHCRMRENEHAACVETEAYGKLAKVDFEQANAYVMAERNSIQHDDQLKFSIFIHKEKLVAVANCKKH